MGAACVTIADLARQLGLSQSAVSYALNGEPGASEATCERVRAAAQEQSWAPGHPSR